MNDPAPAGWRATARSSSRGHGVHVEEFMNKCKHEQQHCSACRAAITLEEEALGWPVATLDGGYKCPDCYGDAYCPCGALLRGDEDVSRCPDCR